MQVDEPDNAQTACGRKLRRLRPSLARILLPRLSSRSFRSWRTNLDLHRFCQFHGYGNGRYDSGAIHYYPLCPVQGRGSEPAGFPRHGPRHRLIGYNAATFGTIALGALQGRCANFCGTGTSRDLNDYPVYAQGGDILDADIYPENDAHPIWWIGRKADRLRYWSNYQKAVFDDMEMNHLTAAVVALSTAEIDAEFWDSM